MKSNGRTAYDIRLELLELANQILSVQCTAIAQDGSSSFRQPSSAPTVDEIIAVAERLNKFVSNT